MATVNKIDSNITELRFAEEASFDTLPGSPIWYPLEPNTYSDFGGSVTLLARNPISADRQRKKGVITDLDASGGFNTDLTQTNLQRILQGFFFADLRTKAEFDSSSVTNVDGTNEEYELTAIALSAAVAAGGSGYTDGDTLSTTGGTGTAATFTATVSGGAVTAVTLVTAGSYTVVPTDPVTTSGGTGTGCTLNVLWDTENQFYAGDLLWAKDFTNAANNGLKNVIATIDENHVSVTEDLVDEASPTGTISRVGALFGTADLNVVVTGTFPTLTSTTKDFTQLGLTPGDWVFVGGDTAGLKFANAVNNGFKRVLSIAQNVLTFDKSDSTMVAETGTGLTIQIFCGRVLKNETGTLITRRSYNLERKLGAPDDAAPSAIQSEYLTGAIPSELTLSVNTADKVNADLSFVAADSEQRTASTGVKSGSRPALVEADAFNTSSDFTRIRLAVYDGDDEAPTPLFAFVQELTVTINNNLSPAKAVGVLGAFEVTAGTFAVGGSMTAYFSDVAGVSSVRNNADITLDFAIVKANAGILVDIPLLSLGDGRPNVAQDEPITLPLTNEAATGAKVQSALNYTLLMVFFDYLPDAAE
jgi:hypothetical protein